MWDDSSGAQALMRRAMGWNGCAAVLTACLLAGCVGDNGNVTVSSLGTEPIPQIGTPAPVSAPVSMGPLLEGPVGAKLGEADRRSAFMAETEALASGERKTWRGGHGIYGFVVPGGSTSGASECRSFTHTIYFAGRPQTATGTGCRDPQGAWVITG